jgi:hypothetical protein
VGEGVDMSTVDGIDAVDAVDVHTDLMCPWAYQASLWLRWDLVTGWLEFPALYEVRRPKTSGDWARIGDSFAPYLSARDWPTIQNEVL